MLKKIVTTSITTILIAISLFLTSHMAIPQAYAAGANDFTPPITVKPEYLPGPSKDQLQDKDARNTLTQEVLPKFAIRFIGIIGSLALIFMIIGGLRYMTAYGDEDATENAKNQVFYAFIGFLISIFAYTIVTIVINLEFKSNTSSGPAEGPPQEQHSN